MSERRIIVAPSLLSADMSILGQEADRAKSDGAEWLHYDVMDGHFAPNLTFGPDIVHALYKHGLYNDVHLMITDPLKYARKFIGCGADSLTFHYEAVDDPIEAAEEIRRFSPKVKVGISIKPRTSIDVLLPFVNHFDMVLIMSVEPGFSGQSFIPSSLDKIKKLRQYIDDNGYSTLIQVDGGVNDENVAAVREAGVDVIVTGNYYFKSADRKAAIRCLKGTI